MRGEVTCGGNAASARALATLHIIWHKTPLALPVIASGKRLPVGSECAAAPARAPRACVPLAGLCSKRPGAPPSKQILPSRPPHRVFP